MNSVKATLVVVLGLMLLEPPQGREQLVFSFEGGERNMGCILATACGLECSQNTRCLAHHALLPACTDGTVWVTLRHIQPTPDTHPTPCLERSGSALTA